MALVYVWLYMAVYGCLWLSMTIDGIALFTRMAIHGADGTHDMHGTFLAHRAAHGQTWLSTKSIFCALHVTYCSPWHSWLLMAVMANTALPVQSVSEANTIVMYTTLCDA